MQFIFRQQTPAKQMTPRQALFIMPIFAILGILLTVFWGIPTARNATKSQQWPSVEGSITLSDMATNYDSEDGSVTYSAKVFYAYSVGGTAHTGSTVSFGDYGSSDPSHAGGIVSRYPAGSRVQVYYDPVDPNNSVLEPGATWSSFVGVIAGIVFLVIGILGFVVSLRKIRSKTDTTPEPPAALSVQQ